LKYTINQKLGGDLRFGQLSIADDNWAKISQVHDPVGRAAGGKGLGHPETQQAAVVISQPRPCPDLECRAGGILYQQYKGTLSPNSIKPDAHARAKIIVLAILSRANASNYENKTLIR
jgi:hypothetical protein